jgi:hypothetical protein
MNLKKNIALSDTGFVFNPSSGDSFSTNPVGIEIIKLLKDKKTTEEIKEYITKTYNTDETTFEKDFYDFIKTLSKMGLIDTNEKKEN